MPMFKVYCKMNVAVILRFVQLTLGLNLLLMTTSSFAGTNRHHVIPTREDVVAIMEHKIPRFDVLIPGIDANIGETVLLPCTVRNLGDRVVSWIRTQDLSILTSGAFIFSADPRFESVHNVDADFWGLRIRGVRPSDTGQYECQVNTDPKMNLAINLSIIDKRVAITTPSGTNLSVAKIKASREVFIRTGSVLTLTCDISHIAEDDMATRKVRVQWLHESKEITSKFQEGGVSLETDYRQGKISSRLILNDVQARHAGRYTCTRQSSTEDTIKVHVTEVDHVEAMQRDSAYFSSGHRWRTSLLIFSFLIFCLT